MAEAGGGVATQNVPRRAGTEPKGPLTWEPVSGPRESDGRPCPQPVRQTLYGAVRTQTGGAAPGSGTVREQGPAGVTCLTVGGVHKAVRRVPGFEAVLAAVRVVPAYGPSAGRVPEVA